ncbi:fatty acyl-AMP ligase [Amycolatopsis nigrescens]|uniref:fatty acyl-AMP ligase n=1 Tax=Amycolatopsis nigrescens TaxID=381445 RepID=UPI000367257A|nr:fatty acyl-AMP ligase [Amycolatopsis nigrescens]
MNQPTPAMTLSASLTRWARRRGGEVAVTEPGFRSRGESVHTSLTWRGLDRRVDALAGHLQLAAAPGERVAVLVGQTTDYLVAVLAAIRAGLVAVPLFPPGLAGHTERLAAVLTDCEPAVVLTTAADSGTVRAFLREHDLDTAEQLPVDVLAGTAHLVPQPVDTGPEDVACLQYTSGSTRPPVGVMITHANLAAGVEQAIRAYGVTPGRSVTVNWMPLCHHVGFLLSVALPVLAGLRTVLLTPSAFLSEPVRWLRALTEHPGAVSAAPSAAYGYCASRIVRADKTGLDLGRVTALIDAGEPTQPQAIDRFCQEFAEHGLHPQTLRTCYGLAEATALTSATPAGAAPARRTFFRAQLGRGHAVPCPAGDPDGITLVSAGRPVGQLVRIVDPATAEPAEDGQVGEIWVSGPNVARGYWQRHEDSAETFCAQLRHGMDPEPRWWLRTGDLGVLAGDELYVTGRIKDLITVDGRRHYPQDVEATVERAHPAVRRRAVVVFVVPAPEGEQAVVLAERARSADATEVDTGEFAGVVRRAVAVAHGLALRDVLLLPPGGVPRTASGKISRAAGRASYLAGNTHAAPSG